MILIEWLIGWDTNVPDCSPSEFKRKCFLRRAFTCCRQHFPRSPDAQFQKLIKNTRQHRIHSKTTCKCLKTSQVLKPTPKCHFFILRFLRISIFRGDLHTQPGLSASTTKFSSGQQLNERQQAPWSRLILYRHFFPILQSYCHFCWHYWFLKILKSSSCTTTKMAHNTGTEQTAYVYIAVISEYFFRSRQHLMQEAKTCGIQRNN